MNKLQTDIVLKRGSPKLISFRHPKTKKLLYYSIKIPVDKADEEAQTIEEYLNYEFFHEYLHYFLEQNEFIFSSKKKEEFTVEYCMACISEYRSSSLRRLENIKSLIKPFIEKESATAEDLKDTKYIAALEKVINDAKPI